jgi:protein required for attachment to host cells
MKTRTPSPRARTHVSFTDTAGTRIVVAGRAEALFFDVDAAGTLTAAGHMTDDKARLRDRSLVSDRPGRVFDHAPPATGRRGAVAHHGADGENSAHKHQATVFARRIGTVLDQDRRRNRFQRVALVAAPGFLGLLRESLKGPLAKMLTAHVPVDLMHRPAPRLKAQLAQMLARGEL